ncbi:MAG TPA: CpaF family protein [Acidimicrobiia bacterium]|nr:CpaF family protein [Acidimicrobiia bacterium]
MKLSERITRAKDTKETPGRHDAPTNGKSDAGGADAADPFVKLQRRAHKAIAARLGERLYNSSLSKAQLEREVVAELNRLVKEERIPLDAAERQVLAANVTDAMLAHGPLERFLSDPEVTEIMVNGTERIFVERAGRLETTDAAFATEEDLRRVIDRIVGEVGRRVDEASPMVDARLEDGSRVNAVIRPLSLDGPALTIRKFSRRLYGLDDAIALGTLTEEAAAFLSTCVRGRASILVSGGTGTGKTTLLNLLSSMIPRDERVVTIEDAAELRLDRPNLVRLETRPPNTERAGEIKTRDLFRNALRMRPDRIIIGEVRGEEALDMLQAMNTGHEGSLSTLHANSPRDALARLETMVLMSGVQLPLLAIRQQEASAIDLLVHVTRNRDGGRYVTHITEVAGVENDTITLSDIFTREPSGTSAGLLRATGIRPQFLANVEYRAGNRVSPKVFESATVTTT